ncbi:MAG: GNAT family protein [Halobacteriales archaeon]|nr:GNAT family protein [Halobacteriales archaeon]
MPGPVFIEGDRIDLHVIEESDAETIQRLVNRPEVRTDLGMATPIALHEEKEWITSDDDGVSLLIGLEEEPIGSISMDEPSKWGTSNISYYLDPERWGNGYTSEALHLLARYAFNERRVAKLTGDVYETNDASAGVMESVGFVQEGRRRKEAFVDGERIDVLRYGLLADEYEYPE